jgi:hypothetical protein
MLLRIGHIHVALTLVSWRLTSGSSNDNVFSPIKNIFNDLKEVK